MSDMKYVLNAHGINEDLHQLYLDHNTRVHEEMMESKKIRFAKLDEDHSAWRLMADVFNHIHEMGIIDEESRMRLFNTIDEIMIEKDGGKVGGITRVKE